jgi:branched-chain amino acid transport system permease protein
MALVGRATPWLFVAIALALPVAITGSYPRHILVLCGIFAVLALSLNVILGYLGELSFGHSAFFGIGAYTSALLALRLDVPFWGGLVGAAILSGLVGLAIGYLTLRIKGPQFAIVTLGFGAILHLIANHWISLTRGPMGLTKIPPPPAVTLPFVGRVEFTTEVPYYYLTLAVVGATIYAIHTLVESRTGRAFLAVRENDALAASIGVNVFGMKLLGFVIATMIVGVGGSLYAHYLRFIAPAVFDLYYVVAMIIMVIVGGKGTIAGPVVGALVFVGLLEFLRVAGTLRLVFFGALLTVSIVFVPGGLVSVWQTWRDARRPRPVVATPPAAAAPVGALVAAPSRTEPSTRSGGAAIAPLLRATGLTKRFGGLVAVNQLDLHVGPDEIVGLIGPNGAGKTTAFNMFAGMMRATEGRIIYKDVDVSSLPSHRIAALGVVRTFQHTSLFPTLSVLQNVKMGTHRTMRGSFVPLLWGAPGARASERAAEAKAWDVLAFLQMTEQAGVRADSLSYGEQRKLEIAIALAADPQLLLLDEPAAGMNPEEGQRLMDVIRAIRERGVAILLVEHSMRVVMGISDRIVVLDHGVKIAEGKPAEVAGHSEVIRVYLGRKRVNA